MSIKVAGSDSKYMISTMRGTEYISRPFEFEAIVLVQNPNPWEEADVSLSELVGEVITVSHDGGDGPNTPTRYFNGICESVSRNSVDQDFTEFTITFVPKFKLFDQNRRSRYFQSVMLDEVIRKVLNERGIACDVATGVQTKFETCVQYQESDFNFVTRLLEEHGVSYWFTHTASSHKMIVKPDPNSAGPQEKFQIVAEGLSISQRSIATKTQMDDFDYSKSAKQTAINVLRPSASVGAHAITLKTALGTNHVAIAPASATARTDKGDSGAGVCAQSENLAGASTQRFANQGLVLSGISLESRLHAGTRVQLATQSNAIMRFNGAKVLVTSVTHEIRNSGWSSRDQTAYDYRASFTCVPEDLKFVPPITAQRPVISGLLRGVVTKGADASEGTERFARVQVKFLWEEDTPSAWVRVASPMAGATQGMIQIPHVGEEVIIGFENGDPDAPIIIGSLYNSMNMPPFALPANRTMTGCKVKSIGGGGTFNQFSFENKSGSEQIYTHAAKDLKSDVLNDEIRLVKNNRNRTVKGKEEITVDKDRTVDVKGKETKNIIGAETIESKQKIVLKVGASQIEITAAGITISAPMITIDAKAKLDAKSSGATTLQGLATTIKGAIVQIN